MTNDGYVTSIPPPSGTFEQLCGSDVQWLIDTKNYMSVSGVVGKYSLKSSTGQIEFQWLPSPAIGLFQNPVSAFSIATSVDQDSYKFEGSSFNTSDVVTFQRGMPFKEGSRLEGRFQNLLNEYEYILFRSDGTCDIYVEKIARQFTGNIQIQGSAYALSAFGLEITQQGVSKRFTTCQTKRKDEIWLEECIFVVKASGATSSMTIQIPNTRAPSPLVSPSMYMQPAPVLNHRHSIAIIPDMFRSLSIKPPDVACSSLFGTEMRERSIEGLFVGVQQSKTKMQWLPLTLCLTHSPNLVYGSTPKRGSLSTANGPFMAEQIASIEKPTKILSGQYEFNPQTNMVTITWDTIQLAPTYKSALPTKPKSQGSFTGTEICFPESEFFTAAPLILKKARAFPTTGISIDGKYVSQKDPKHYVHFSSQGTMKITEPALLEHFPEGFKVDRLVYRLGHYSLEIQDAMSTGASISSDSDIMAFTVYLPDDTNDILVIEKIPFILDS